MKRFRHCRILLSLFLLLYPAHGITQDRETILFRLDCTTADIDGKQWLQNQGITLKKGLKQDDVVQLIGTRKKGLQFTVLQPSLGLALLDGLHVEEVDRVELEWGVDQYPQGASWDQGVNREALMVTLFFGSKVTSDRFYLPASPYFIGLFPCRDDTVGKPFTGKSYQDTGRYVCLDTPVPGTMVTSRFDVVESYCKWFGTEVVPPLTGIGIKVDTSGLVDGTSRAFLKTITLYKRTRESK